MKQFPIIFWQKDPQWGLKQLGTQVGSDIADYGCFDTSFATIARYYGFLVTPAILDDDFTTAHTFIGNDLLMDNALTQIYKDIVYQTSEHYETVPAPLERLQQLNKDPATCIIVCIDLGAGNVHFSPVADCDGVKVILANPWTGQLDNFADLYGDPVKNILRFIIYKGPIINSPLPMPTNVSVPSDIYPNLVHGSTQWDSACSDQSLGDPKATDYDKLKSVIGGYKSRATDIQNQLVTAQTNVTNTTEQASRLKQQLLDEVKLYTDVQNSLNDTLKKYTDVGGLYQGRITVLQDQIDQMGRDKGALNLQIAQLTQQIQNMKSQTTDSLTVGDVVALLIKKIFPIKLR